MTVHERAAKACARRPSGGLKRWIIQCPGCGRGYTVEDLQTGEPPTIYSGGLIPVSRCIQPVAGGARLCNADLRAELAGEPASAIAREVTR